MEERWNWHGCWDAVGTPHQHRCDTSTCDSNQWIFIVYKQKSIEPCMVYVCVGSPLYLLLVHQRQCFIVHQLLLHWDLKWFDYDWLWLSCKFISGTALQYNWTAESQLRNCYRVSCTYRWLDYWYVFTRGRWWCFISQIYHLRRTIVHFTE